MLFPSAFLASLAASARRWNLADWANETKESDLKQPPTPDTRGEDRWLSVDEIADHLGIKRDTVYKWIGERQLPGHKIGRPWKFNRKAVDEWVKSGAATDPQSGQYLK